MFKFFFTAMSSHVIKLVKSSGGPMSNVAVTALLFTAMVLGMANAAKLANVIKTVSVNNVVYVITTVTKSTSRSLGAKFVMNTAPSGRRINRVVNIITSSTTVKFILCLLGRT